MYWTTRFALSVFLCLPLLLLAQTNKGRSNSGSLVIGAPKAPPALHISNIRFEDTDGNQQIDASEKGIIRFQLQNTGKGDAVGLRLISKDLSQTQSLSFPAQSNLGVLKAGETQSYSLELKADKKLPTGTASFELKVLEANGFDSDPFRINIPTQEFLKPAVSVVDYAFSAENGQALLGNSLKLTVLVQNTGLGIAKNVQLGFQLDSNVYPLGDLQYNLGQLEAGQTKQIDFEFVANKRYLGTEIDIQSILTENYGLYGQKQSFSIKLDKVLPKLKEVQIASKQNSTSISTASLPDDQTDFCQDDFDFNQTLPRVSSTNENAFAILIGNRDYQNNIDDVEYAFNDIERMKQYLIQIMGYKEGNIVVLRNADLATMYHWFGFGVNNVNSKLKGIIKSPEISDLLVYYSGHGVPATGGSEEGKSFLLPVNGHQDNPEGTAFPLRSLYKCLKEIPARSKTVILEACFSGAPLRLTTSGRPVIPIPEDLSDPDLVVFSAASGTQDAHWYHSKGHGMFTYFFFKAILDWKNTDTDDNKELSAQEIYTYITKQDELPYYLRCIYNSKREQAPKLLGDNTDHILVRMR